MKFFDGSNIDEVDYFHQNQTSILICRGIESRGSVNRSTSKIGLEIVRSTHRSGETYSVT